MHYAPAQEKCPLAYSPFKSCTVPRPIGWLSSISNDGIANLAPHSQWQNLTFDPHMVMFAANRYPDGRRKDTVVNAEQTGWFVWNIATYNLRESVNTSAMALDANEDEFIHASVNKINSIDCPVPRVEQSPCHFECRYLSTQSFEGHTPVGGVDVVFAEVTRIHVQDEVILESGKLDISAIRPIARMGYYDYAVVNDTFEMIIPGASEVEKAGLEGKA